MDAPRFYLARRIGLREVELVDGGHDDQAGVTKAAKIWARIYNDHGPWIMVSTAAVPEIDRVDDGPPYLFERLRSS